MHLLTFLISTVADVCMYKVPNPFSGSLGAMRTWERSRLRSLHVDEKLDHDLFYH